MASALEFFSLTGDEGALLGPNGKLDCLYEKKKNSTAKGIVQTGFRGGVILSLSFLLLKIAKLQLSSLLNQFF